MVVSGWGAYVQFASVASVLHLLGGWVRARPGCFLLSGGLGGGGTVFQSWSGCFGCVVVRVHWVLSDLGLGDGGIGGGSGLSYYFIYMFNIIFRSLWLCVVFLWLVLGVGHFIVLW